MLIARRRFMLGVGASVLAAPAIVRVSSLMRISPTAVPILEPEGWLVTEGGRRALDPRLPIISAMEKARQEACFAPTAFELRSTAQGRLLSALQRICPHFLAAPLPPHWVGTFCWDIPVVVAA